MTQDKKRRFLFVFEKGKTGYHSPAPPLQGAVQGTFLPTFCHQKRGKGGGRGGGKRHNLYGYSREERRGKPSSVPTRKRTAIT